MHKLVQLLQLYNMNMSVSFTDKEIKAHVSSLLKFTQQMDTELGFIPKDSLSSYIIKCLCVYSNMEIVHYNRNRETRSELSSNLPRRGKN